MLDAILPTREPLAAASRLQGWRVSGQGVAAFSLLAVCGISAAAITTVSDFGLRMPGHAILRTVLPLTLGLALVPRAGAGTAMSLMAWLATLVFRGLGFHGGGVGATTSLVLTGPLLDAASLAAQRGWQLYLAFAIAGLTSNSFAFVARWLAKSIEGPSPGRRGAGEWWPQAILTYAAFGLVAGLLSALVCFRFSSGPQPPADSAA